MHTYLVYTHRFIFTALLCLLPMACASYPQYRNQVTYQYTQSPTSGKSSKVTKDSITITDAGNAKKIIQPVLVQACRNGRLLIRKTRMQRYNSLGQKEIFYINKPVMEKVDPLANIHVHQLVIHNGTDHSLRLSQISVTLVDPSGKDHEMLASTSDLYRHIRNNRPCSSTSRLIAAVQSHNLSFIGGGNHKILPGREKNLHLAFPGIKLNIPGEWRVELYDFPTRTNEAGVITKKTKFEFSFNIQKYRTTTRQKKQSLFAQWKPISRKKVKMTR